MQNNSMSAATGIAAMGSACSMAGNSINDLKQAAPSQRTFKIRDRATGKFLNANLKHWSFSNTGKVFTHQHHVLLQLQRTMRAGLYKSTSQIFTDWEIVRFTGADEESIRIEEFFDGKRF